jgi:hypothetical protein
MFRWVSAILIVTVAPAAHGAPSLDAWGFKLGAGGRYDDVRMCVATDPGVKGGAAAEGSLFIEVGKTGGVSATINLPVLRPILFAVAFKMLQLEPDIALSFRHPLGAKLDLLFGPTLGLSFHYGPDYRSGPKDEERGPSFFAVGPKLGAFVALEFKRPGGSYNYQVGISPYVAPLFALDGPQFPDGIVAGGMLEGTMRFPVGGK